METKTNITISELTTEGVIIRILETMEYAGQTIPLRDNKTHYPNSVTGRRVFAEAVQGQDRVYDTVMTLWGDEPVISEKAETEPIEGVDIEVEEAPEPELEIEEMETENEPEGEEVSEDTRVEETVDLSKLTVVELKALAKEAGISGYSTMTKAELIEILEALRASGDEVGGEDTTEDNPEGAEESPEDDE